MEPKYRKLPKHSKSMQEKILRFDQAVKFLQVAGFTDDGENLSLVGFEKEKLSKAEKAIEDFVASLGAHVTKTSSAFDPYKPSISSYSGVSQKQALSQMGVIRPEEKNKLDLQKDEILRIKREREESYEGKLENREIEVYNHNSRILLK